LNVVTLRWLLLGQVIPDLSNQTCFAEARIEDRCRDRSSSKDGTDQLIFSQITLDKVLKEEPSIISGCEAFQTEIRDRVLHGLAPEKAF
jgi:hypothetical protein